MAYPANVTFADKVLNCQLVDVSAASIAYVAPGVPGKLERAYCCISAAITGSNGTVTIKKGSTTIGTISLVVSGSAIGSVFEAVFTGSEADRTFAATDTIILDSDGASSTTSIGVFTLVLRSL